MGAIPGFFQRGGGEIAAIGTGNGGPEMQAVLVVDAVEAGEVYELTFFAVAVYVFGDEAEGLDRIVPGATDRVG